MPKRLFTVILLINILACFTVQAQRRLPYPILFVHGFAGTSANWQPFVTYLSERTGMYAAPNNRLDYCLNSDGNQAIAQVYATSNWRSDIVDYNLRLDPSDLYVINFDTCPLSGGSNRSAAVKQGYAVGLAVARILAVTGSDKVILMGHSMGGLAIREYLQTTSHWATNDGRHHVAKVVTVGTPHGGSNLGTGDFYFVQFLTSLATNDKYDEQSEAVRDLRIDYKTGYKGVYLFGGFETGTYIRQGTFGSYYNLDVNCNGRSGDLIQGLNQKDLYTDLDYAMVVGNGYGAFGDGVVTAPNQNLNNFYPIYAPVFYHNSFHTSTIKEAIFQQLFALDEPDRLDKAYAVGFNQSYLGMLTVQANGSWRDTDRYRYKVPGRGVVTAQLNVSAEAGAISRLLAPAGQPLVSLSGSGSLWALVPSGGEQYLEIEGTSASNWRNYYYNLAFCPMPTDPVIATNGVTGLCAGESTTLTATAGFDTYMWYRDGTRIEETSSQLSVNIGGTYTVQGEKCGLNRSTGSFASIRVYPKPAVPTIVPDPTGKGLLSSAATGNQWLLNGSPILGATSPVLPYSFLSSGVVSLEVNSPQGCRTASSPFVITANEPLAGSNQLSVTPNPAFGVVQVKTDVAPPYALTVVNLMGQPLWRKAVTTRVKEHSVDMTGWPAGLYLVRLESSGTSQMIKLLVH